MASGTAAAATPRSFPAVRQVTILTIPARRPPRRRLGGPAGLWHTAATWASIACCPSFRSRGMGAVIHTNSWHDNTAGAGKPATYNQTAADVDTFTWNNEDHLVLGSAGNTGEEQGPPGTAKNAICVGAAQADPNEMNFGDGNAGPTADGRNKPDLDGVGLRYPVVEP